MALNVCGWVLNKAGNLINECRRGTRRNNRHNENNAQNTRQPTVIEEFIKKVNAILSLNIQSVSNNESVLRTAFDTVTRLETERVLLEAEYSIHISDNLGLHQQERARIYDNFLRTREYIALVKGRLETALTPFNREHARRNYEEYMRKQYAQTPAAVAAAERFQQQKTEKIFVRERVDAKFYEWQGSMGSAYQWKLKAERSAESAASLLTRINPRIMNRTISTIAILKDAVKKIEHYARIAANAAKEADKATNVKNINKYIEDESKMMYGIAADKKQMWSNIWVQVETMVINASKEYARDAKAAAERASISEVKVHKLEQDIEDEQKRYERAAPRPKESAAPQPQQQPRPQPQQQPRPQPQQQPRPQPQQQPPPPPKKSTPDFYKVMGIPKTATADHIKEAYRRLAKQLHPDKCKKVKEICEKEFKELNQANMVLSVPKWKGKYDNINGNYTYKDLEREMEKDIADGALRGGSRSRTMRRKRMRTSDA
jgi:hypothetical protein